MSLLAAENISKSFRDQTLLEEVSFTLLPSDRIGLVGKNGIGKTTLLEILAGQQEIDYGRLVRSRTLVVDYVEQEKLKYANRTLAEFVSGARADLSHKQSELKALEAELAERPTDKALLNKLGQSQIEFEQAGGFGFENEVKTILTGLGFDPARHNERMGNFSGGEQNRAGLARILAGAGQLLLLDEPTNHLDIESTRWLEEYLGKLDKALIIVSHDRAFLEATVEKVWEMAYGKIDSYVGGFNKYLKERTDRRRLAAHHYRHQQEEIKRIEDFVRRNMAGQKTKQAQSKLKYLSRMKRLAPMQTDGSGPSISMNSSQRSFNHVLSMEKASFGYGETEIVAEVNLDIYRGDKIGLIGRNGSGKSTILKSLIGELQPQRGSIRLGSNVDVAYFDQGLSDLNLEATVLDNIWEKDPSIEVGKMRSYLARFGFSGDDPFKLVRALSGGEKTKLCLARLLYRPANFIILDEPTNHLDIYAREALETALVEFEGSCLIVSHDRYFLDKVVDRIVHLSNARAKIYDGNYSYFLKAVSSGQPVVRSDKSESKQAFLDFKERSRERGRLKKKIKLMRDKISQLETDLDDLINKIQPKIKEDDWQQLTEAAERRQLLEDEIFQLHADLEELEAREVD